MTAEPLPLARPAGPAADRADADRPDDAAPREALYAPDHPLDVRRTTALLRRGAADPAWRVAPDGALWQATLTPAGPATRRLETTRHGVRVHAWGPGAEHAVAGVPDLLGARDASHGLPAHLHPLVHAAHRRLPGLRVPRSANLVESLVPAILEQRVVGLDAKASWCRLVRRHGLPAPGPAPEGMRVPPPAATWRDLPVWEWRAAGVEEARAGTVRRAMAVADRLQEAVDLPVAEARRRLLTVRGIGEWTVAETACRVLGDTDAVSVGDYHLAHLVGWALTGERTDDPGMVRLLEPWRPHRHRVVRLLEITAAARAPRFGPRSPRARPLR
ncbi:DNA-3-methyladenine glycosylase family protein [Cellulomonas endophytica]|uniref:DNA-3-methyladenine glycosylase family protein n=1 Tax=Cellulomonas endophytica TaxID=2494735 RepID=UPI001F0C9A52|nr:DNA-3-methyladenine glycosylase 2 family protein [Cellulomonas endophytica]